MTTDSLSILVTGAHGQVGTELRRRAPVSVNLRAYDRAGLDIGDGAAVAAAVAAMRPDVIINAAAFTGVDAAETAQADADRGNRQGPGHLAAAAAAHGAAL
ncbi:MAG: sugar nucleotide-binding protein, partial [Thalassobaculaceae bacterium]